ncbi:hypothetical protein [Winogradskyella sp.]|uniref:hypothetical protein n=1 Tax=Winogradskyella sp. TaxID=1883156 RepID=UPI003F6B632C
MSVAIVGIGFFTAGMFEVLDYIIIKALLFGGFGILIIMAFVFAFKNSVKKNRPED